MFRVQGLTAQDTHQWLAGGWGLIRQTPESPLLLVNFTGTNPDTYSTHVRIYSSPSTFTEQIIDLRVGEIYCHWPLCGAINVPINNYTIGVVTERTTERQYRRTYYPRYVECTIPRPWEVMKKHGRESELLVSDSPSLVWGLFFPEYPNIRKALELLRFGERVSIAISPTILLIGGAQRIFIYDKHKHVGHFDGMNVVVTHDDDFIAQRITKHLNTKLERA